jgi:hypothetical protein
MAWSIQRCISAKQFMPNAESVLLMSFGFSLSMTFTVAFRAFLITRHSLEQDAVFSKT